MRHHFNRHHLINWKWSIIWVLIHFVSLFILTWGIQKLGLSNSLGIVFLLGFGVTIISGIIKRFTLKQTFVVDKWFFFWSLINTFTIWLILLLTKLLGITNNLISLFLIAVMLVIVAYFVKRIRKTNRTMIIISIILIIILFFFNWDTGIITTKSEQDLQTADSTFQSQSILSNIKNSINELLSSVAISDNCPQISVSMNQREGLLPFLNIKQYDEWTVASYDSNSQLFGINFGMIFCHNGNRQGQNPKYWYCGDKSSQTTMGYIQKTLVNEDGSLGKTVKMSFYNIYDENENFIKTVCGDDPDKIAEREWDEFKRQADDFWS